MNIVLDLPLPPSVNRLWRRGRNRATGQSITHISAVYKAWKDAASAELMRQRVGQKWHTIETWFTVTVTLPAKRRGKIDPDNFVKAAMDWAQQVGVILNDKWVDRLVVEWGEVPLGYRICFSSVES